MTLYDTDTVVDILSEANEQVNIYDGGKNHVLQYNLPITLETPEDWLAWLLHDAALHEQMAQEEKNDFDRSSYWEDAALMRKYAIALMSEGVQPTEIEWKENFQQKEE